MSRVLLICPDQREGLTAVNGSLPLALAVYLGKPLIEHALHGFAREGVSEVRVFASDRPSELRDYLAGGSAWGLKVEVVPAPDEPTAETLRKRPDFETNARIETLDHLPQAPDVPILASLAAWHASRETLLPELAPGQVGARELTPGVWVGVKARIAPTAVLEAPCWIGHQATIGEHARIGPRAFIENDSLVDAHATVEDSTVGARTYLGGMTHLARSVAGGPVLANWENNSVTRLTDAFLLSKLDAPRDAAAPLTARLLALLVMILTSPLTMLALLLAPLRRRPWIVSRHAELHAAPGERANPVTYHELPALPGVWSRWPRLWRIVTGHFAWTGNPPLDPDEAAALTTEFDRLWLHVAPGLFTAPEAEGCSAPWDDEARAHAALFAGKPDFSWRCRILSRGIRSLFFPCSSVTK